MNKLVSILLLAVLVAASFAAQDDVTPAPAERTLFLLRHAETTDDPGNRPLSDAGRRRSEVLARLLSSAGVTHLYSSFLRRTKQTIEPLAKALELDLVELDARSIDDWTAAAAALPPGAVAVFCGHSNTTPNLAQAFGVTDLPDLVEHAPYGEIFREDAFDRLLIITLPADSITGAALELRYGAGAPAMDVLKTLR